MQKIKLTAKQVNGEWVVIDNRYPNLNEWCVSVRYKDVIQRFGTFEKSYIDECKAIIASTHLDTQYKLDKVQIEDLLRGFSLAEKISNYAIDIEYGTNPIEYNDFVEGMEHGFLLSEQMNKRKFDEEDLRKAIELSKKTHMSDIPLIGLQEFQDYTIDEIIQSLQNPTYIIDVEAEDKFKLSEGETFMGTNYHTHLKEPKQTNGVLKVIKITKQ